MSEGDHSSSREQHHSDWESILEVCIPRLIPSALRLSNGRIYDAEDLVYETICHVLSKNPKDIRNPLRYLFRSLRNTWIDTWKKENAANMESLEAIQDDPARQGELPTVEPEVLRIIKNEELLEELKSGQGPLNDDEKFLINSLLEGQTLEEIAAIVGEDECRTKMRWNALKVKLRYRLRSGKAKAKVAIRK